MPVDSIEPANDTLVPGGWWNAFSQNKDRHVSLCLYIWSNFQTFIVLETSKVLAAGFLRSARLLPSTSIVVCLDMPVLFGVMSTNAGVATNSLERLAKLAPGWLVAIIGCNFMQLNRFLKCFSQIAIVIWDTYQFLFTSHIREVLGATWLLLCLLHGRCLVPRLDLWLLFWVLFWEWKLQRFDSFKTTVDNKRRKYK